LLKNGFFIPAGRGLRSFSLHSWSRFYELVSAVINGQKVNYKSRFYHFLFLEVLFQTYIGKFLIILSDKFSSIFCKIKSTIRKFPPETFRPKRRFIKSVPQRQLSRLATEGRGELSEAADTADAEVAAALRVGGDERPDGRAAAVSILLEL
jgi:hypothetical protein